MTHIFSNQLDRLEASLSECIGAYLTLRNESLEHVEAQLYQNLFGDAVLALMSQLIKGSDFGDTKGACDKNSIITQCAICYGKDVLHSGIR